MENFKFDKNIQHVKKVIQQSSIKKMGLTSLMPKYVQKMEDLRAAPPNIVIAEAIRTAGFIQNKFKQQVLKKKNKYVMGLGVYKQLWYDDFRKVKILKPAAVQFQNVYKPYIGQDLTDKTLLVTRTGGIGDLLFIQPNLIHLKEKYPTCSILFACGPQYQSMIEGWGCIDEILDLPFLFTYLLRSDYHATFEGVIERCKEATSVNAYRLFTKWMGLDLPDEKLVPTQEPKPGKVNECKKFLTRNKVARGFVLLQLRASSPIRTPSPVLWRKIIEQLVRKNHTVIITDSPHMHLQIQGFIDTLSDDVRHCVINFTKESQTLDYTIAMASLADCTISPDSSLIHIAASLRVPGFGLYGAFPGKIRLETYSNIDWIEGKMDCTPCFTHGNSPCRNTEGNNPKCYNTINVDNVVHRVEKLINDKNRTVCEESPSGDEECNRSNS